MSIFFSSAANSSLNDDHVNARISALIAQFPFLKMNSEVRLRGFAIFSRGHATLHLAVSVGRSVRRLVHPVTFLNFEWYLHYCSCLTVRDWIAVYPALFC